MEAKTLVGVLGCCVSRDNFNSIFNKNYSDISKCVIHQNQSSIISVMSFPVEFNHDKIDNLEKEFDKQHLISELDKKFLYKLVEMQPEYLIIDFFGDVIFGVFEYEGSLITNNTWKFPKTRFYKELTVNNKLSALENFDTYFSLWKKSVDDFFAFINKNLPDMKVILNKARFANKYRDERTGEIKVFSESGLVGNIDVEKYNKVWEAFDSYVIEKYHVNLISFNHDLHFVDINHPWNAYYVHYTRNYYSDFLIAFQNIILGEKEILLEKLKSDIKSRDNEIKKLNKVKRHFEDESFIHATKRFMLKNETVRKINNLRHKKKIKAI